MSEPNSVEAQALELRPLVYDPAALHAVFVNQVRPRTDLAAVGIEPP
jgi:hypothetical protein